LLKFGKPNSCKASWNPAMSGHRHRIPGDQIPLKLAKTRLVCRNLAIAAEFWPPSPKFGNSSQNPVKVTGILPASDGILSSMVFTVGDFFVQTKCRKIFLK
jgi:hypothetical protein